MPIDSREVYDHGLGEALFYGLVKCGTAWGMLFELKSAIRTSDTMRTQMNARGNDMEKTCFLVFFLYYYIYIIYILSSYYKKIREAQ